MQFRSEHSIHGNDGNVVFELSDNHRFIRKRCRVKEYYAVYKNCFSMECYFMRQLQRRMGRNEYEQLFPVYRESGCLESGSPYVIMDYIKGQTLEERLSSFGGFVPRYLLNRNQIRHIFDQLSRAEKSLRSVGMIQMDLSPGNIIVCNDHYDIRMIDFTDVYYLSADLRKARYKRPCHGISAEISTWLPLSMQLRQTAAQLFTRLFYCGNDAYYQSSKHEDPFFSREGYGLLVNCLKVTNPNLPTVNSDDLYYWDSWIRLLFKRLSE